MDPIVIFGSARNNGNTKKALSYLLQDNIVPIIDLNDYNIGDFNYDNKNSDDDFLSIIEKIVEHRFIIYATPIYWYSMSSVMKRFIDRHSDLLKWNKPLGRKLRGKTVSLVTSYHDGRKSTTNLVETQFKETVAYLGMEYAGSFHYYSGETKRNLIGKNLVSGLELYKFIFEDFEYNLRRSGVIV